MSRLYHLSYDTINCERHFQGNHNEARRYILCVISSSPVINIYSYTESSFVLEYNVVNPDRLFNFIENNLARYFYYSISLVAQNRQTRRNYIAYKPNNVLNDNLQSILENLGCDNLRKKIVEY